MNDVAMAKSRVGRFERIARLGGTGPSFAWRVSFAFQVSFVFLLTAPAIVEGQTVRGTMTDRTTGQPIAGGVVFWSGSTPTRS
jgi:hypothetical protein